MSKTDIAFAMIVALIMSASLGYYQGTKSCGVTKEVSTDNTVKDIVTTTKEVSRSDGTKEIVTVVVDKTKERRTDTVTVKQAPAPANRVAIALLASDFRQPDYYELRYERRIAGPLWAGASVNTKGTYGLSVAYEF